jgi:hypothetical protein
MAIQKIIIKGMDRNGIIRFEIASGQQLPPGIIAGKEWTLTAETKNSESEEAGIKGISK